MISDNKTKSYTPIPLSDEDYTRQETSWRQALKDIHTLAKRRHLNKKVFISYAWPTEPAMRDQLQRWLKQLQDDLQRAGINVFYDLRDMKGHLDTTMQQQIENSDFVIPVLTPEFLSRVQNSETHLAFEFRLMLEKVNRERGGLLPVLHAGTLEGVVQGPLLPLMSYLIYIGKIDRFDELLVGLSDPVGLIPTIYGIRMGDKDYEAILRKWRSHNLTRLPYVLPDHIPRITLLEQLHQSFQQQQESGEAPIQVIQGIGGMGKTQLASWYSHHYANSAGFIRWISADHHNLSSEWLRLGELLGLDLKGLAAEAQYSTIRRTLAKYPKWMIIFDNMENQHALQNLLPEKQSALQQVLITTRSKNWGRLPVLNVDEFTAEESRIYCQKSLKPEQCVGIDELAARLGYLPLALSQAIAYMQQTGIHARQYLERYQKTGIALLARAHTILTTWMISIEALTEYSSKAAEAVKFCAYLYSDGIEERILQQVLGIDELELDDYIAVIRDYGLLTRGSNGFKMHRLVQEAICYQEASVFAKAALFTQRIKPLAQALHLLCLEQQQKDSYELLQLLQPHLKIILEHLESFGADAPFELDSPANWQADLLLQKSRFFLATETSKAFDCAQKALTLYQKMAGEQHPNVADGYRSLGRAYRMLGNIKSALLSHEKALAIYIACYGSLHSKVAICYNELGLSHHMFGDDKLALINHEKALEIQLKVNDAEDFNMILTYNHLGQAYGNLGDTHTALDHQKKALAIALKIYGENHPNVADCYYHLSCMHLAAKDMQSAITLQEKALAIRIDVYGEAYPQVARSYNSLGSAHHELGDAKSAQTYFEKAIAIQLKLYGEENPNVAVFYLNLGKAHGTLGNAQSATACYEKALAIRLKIFGADHPLVAECHGILQ